MKTKIALALLFTCALQQQAIADSAAGGCAGIDRKGYPTGVTVSAGTTQPYIQSCIVCKSNGEWTYVENSRCGLEDSWNLNSKDRSRRQSSASRSRSSPGSGLR
jgi:hypothetical protein